MKKIIKKFYEDLNTIFDIILLKIDSYLLIIKYLLLLNKNIYELIFFFNNNKIIKIIILFKNVIVEELSEDYDNLKKNIKKFRLFHRDMKIIFVPFY
jgi:hypothetical protein